MSIEGLASALFPAARLTVLSELLLHPGRRFSLNQLCQVSDTDATLVRQELERLSNAGIIEVQRDGGRETYAANTACPVHDELRLLLAKTVGLQQVISEKLEPYSDRIEWAYIYGSIARGIVDIDSDIDLLIVGLVTLPEISGIMAQLSIELDWEINPMVYSPEKYLQRLAEGDHFITNVHQNPKVVLLGKEPAR